MSDRTGLDGSDEAVDLDAIEARATAAAAMGLRFLTERYIPDGEINRYNMDVEQLAEDDVLALVAAVRTLRAENERLAEDAKVKSVLRIGVERDNERAHRERANSEVRSLRARLAEVEAEREAAKRIAVKLGGIRADQAAQLAAVERVVESIEAQIPLSEIVRHLRAALGAVPAQPTEQDESELRTENENLRSSIAAQTEAWSSLSAEREGAHLREWLAADRLIKDLRSLTEDLVERLQWACKQAAWALTDTRIQQCPAAEAWLRTIKAGMDNQSRDMPDRPEVYTGMDAPNGEPLMAVPHCSACLRPLPHNDVELRACPSSLPVSVTQPQDLCPDCGALKDGVHYAFCCEPYPPSIASPVTQQEER